MASNSTEDGCTQFRQFEIRTWSLLRKRKDIGDMGNAWILKFARNSYCSVPGMSSQLANPRADPRAKGCSPATTSRNSITANAA